MEILHRLSLADHDKMLVELQKNVENILDATSLNVPASGSPPSSSNQNHFSNFQLRIFLPFLKTLLDDLKHLTTYQQKILFRLFYLY